LLVHFYREIARDLDVLLLILSDRHEIAIVNQDIGGHQHGVGKKAGRGGHAASELVLIGVGALEEAHRGERG
jgi:hypothetical protein